MRLSRRLILLLLSAVIVHVAADCVGGECFDIVFVIDGTGITQDVEDDFKQTLLFMSNVTNMFTIGSSDTLFGLYIIGRDVGQRMVIPLPSFNTTASLREKLRQITFQGKETTDVNMHTALDIIRTTYMNEQNGLRRKSATCVVVLLVRGLDPHVDKLNAAATLIKQEGVNIYAIKISHFSSSQLQAIVSAQDFLFDGRNMNQLETFIKPLVESVKLQEKCKTVNITVSDDIHKQGSCLNSRILCKTWTDRNINRVLSLSNFKTSTNITDYIELKQLDHTNLLCFRRDIRNVIQKFMGVIRANTREFDSIAVTVNIVEIDDAPVLKNDTIAVYYDVTPETQIPIAIEDPDTAAPATDVSVTLIPGQEDKFEVKSQNSKDWFVVVKSDLLYLNKTYVLLLKLEDTRQLTRIVNLTVIIKWRPSCELPTDPFKAFYPGRSFSVSLSKYCTLRPQEGSEQMSEIYFEINKVWNERPSCIVEFEIIGRSILTVRGFGPMKLQYENHVETSFPTLSNDYLPDNVGTIGELSRQQNDMCTVPILVRFNQGSITMNVTLIVISCAPSTDNKGRMWNRTAPGTVSTLPCDSNNVGSIKRPCSNDGVFQNPQNNCTRKDIAEKAEMINGIINEIIGVKTPDNVRKLNEALDNMLNQTMPQETSLQEGDIKNVQNVLDKIANLTEYTKIKTDVNFSTLLGIADNLIDTNDINTWSSLIQNEDTGAETIVGTVDTLVSSMVSSLNVTSELTYSKRNLVVTITPTSTCQDAITRDDKSYYNLSLGCKNVEKALSFASVAYQSLSKLVTTKRIDEGNISAPQPLSSNNTLTVNTAVISLSISPKRKTKLATPVVLTFKPIKHSRTDAVCVSIDTYKTGVKYWTSSGCRTSRSSTGHVVCECDHLSNFAVLMSTYGTPAEHAFALMVISHVGGILSIICSALTVVVYVVLWLRKHRPIQNQRSAVLINLCCAICITYTLFLSGISKTNNKDGCTAIAVILHYMFLVVIFALFGEGVMLAGMVIFPLKKWRTGRYTIPLSWSFPLVIIGISMGATKLSGYGDNTACWLSKDTGLMWAFLAPVVFVIVINIGIMVMVFRAIFQTRVFKKKSEKQKAKIGLRNLCILVPVMGVTWILGVFAVDERTVVFQYLFTIFNSLQGVFIFVMHCVLNKQVQEAFKKEKGKLLSQLASSKQDTQMKTLKSTTTNENRTNSETDALKGEDKTNTTSYRNQAIHFK